MNVNPVIEKALQPFAPNACFKCLSIEKDVCLLGGQCYRYSAQNVKTEVVRRKRVQAERLQRELERLMEEIERLSE